MTTLATLVATVAAAASAMFAAIGMIFAGRQLQITRKQHKQDEPAQDLAGLVRGDLRVGYDGSQGQPTHRLTMNHPVLAGGERRTWRRRLRIPFEARRSLKENLRPPRVLRRRR